MISAVGLALVAFLGLMFAICLQISDAAWPCRRWQWVGWGMLAVALVLLLFRPAEEIEVGEDAAAYFHAAMVFAKKGELFISDPALQDISVQERSLFRYGHPGFLLTKDSVLWADTKEMDSVGPFFFPGYSLLMAVPIALGFPYAALLLSPLLALLIGVLLGIWGRWITGRPEAFWLAFTLYVLNPVIVWNARCVRAEWPASFLVLAGLTIWMGHVVMGKKASRVGAFIAGLALASASIFHITAIYVLLPTMVWALWCTRSTSMWCFWWGGLVMGMVLFALQLVWVADPYWILDNLLKAGRRPTVAAVAVAVIVAVQVARWLYERAERYWPRVHAYGGPALGGAMCLVFWAAVAYGIWENPEQGRLPGLPSWTASYISLTDFAGVQRMISRVALLAALVGLPILCLRSGVLGQMGRALFFVLAPASLTIGWVYNYLFETRRMVPFLVPLLILATVSLIQLIAKGIVLLLRRTVPECRRWTPALNSIIAMVITLVFVGVGIRGRAQLFTGWNNRGTLAFYEALAEKAQTEGDFLFAEYTQTAVPVERLSGLPLLPVAWGYRSESEYRAVEEVFRRLVEQHPDRRHLLVTPFSGCSLPGLMIEPLDRMTLNSARMARARRMVPDGPHPFIRTMHIYSIHRAGHDGEGHPYRRVMDGGLLGLEGTANWMPNRTITIEGIPVQPATPLPSLWEWPSSVRSGHVRWVFYCPAGVSETSLALRNQAGDEIAVRSVELGGAWLALETDHSVSMRLGALYLTSTKPVFLTDAFVVDETNAVTRMPLPLERLTMFAVSEVDSQWFRASSSLALPVYPGTTRWLWVMATRGREDTVHAEVTLRPRGNGDVANKWTVQSGWSWHLIPLAAVDRANTYWYDVTVDPAWDPGLSNFPADLGLRIHRIMVE